MTPDASDYDRDVIVVSTRRLRNSQLLNSAAQVLAYLEQKEQSTLQDMPIIPTNSFNFGIGV